MVKTPRWVLPFAGNSGQDVDASFNDLLRFFDAFVSGLILDKDLTAPPGGESTGDAYIVGGSATGAWSGKDDDLAVYYYGTWYFLTPWNGFTVWVDDESTEYRWESTAWAEVTSGGSLTGSGAANRVAYWSGASALTSNADLTYDGTTLQLGDGASVTPSSTAQTLVIGDSASEVGMTFAAQGNTARTRVHFRTPDDDFGFMYAEHDTAASNEPRMSFGYQDGSNYIDIQADYTARAMRIYDESGGVGTASLNASLFLKEQASAKTDVTAFGQWWVRNDTPNTPMFTTDAGDDWELVPKTGSTVAGLPTAVVGKIARVTDANSPSVGSTVSGGGAAAALVWYNGSNWTVIGV